MDDTKKQTIMNYPTLRVVFDRKKLATKEKKGLVQVEVAHDGKRKWIGTGVKVYAGQWKDRRMVCERADAMELNDQINIIVGNIREWINSLYKDGGAFSFEKLDGMLERVENPESFILFVERRIEERKVDEGTKKQHRVMLRALREFGLIQFFQDVTLKNIKSWDDYVKGRVKAKSSVYGYHKRLKVYVREAFQMDLIKKNPYDGFPMPRVDETSRKYLERDELERIEAVDIPDSSISRVRDCFVFCCFTGIEDKKRRRANEGNRLIVKTNVRFCL